MHQRLGSLVTLRSDNSAGCGVCSYAGPNDCGDKEQVCMISNQVQVKVISEGGYGPFCDRSIEAKRKHHTISKFQS